MLMTGLAFGAGEGRAFFGDGEGRGYLGVTITTVDYSDAEGTQEGVYIGSVSHGSGAEAAGLKPSRICIVSINGSRVEDMGDLEAQTEDTHGPAMLVDLVVLARMAARRASRSSWAVVPRRE